MHDVLFWPDFKKIVFTMFQDICGQSMETKLCIEKTLKISRIAIYMAERWLYGFITSKSII